MNSTVNVITMVGAVIQAIVIFAIMVRCYTLSDRIKRLDAKLAEHLAADPRYYKLPLWAPKEFNGWKLNRYLHHGADAVYLKHKYYVTVSRESYEDIGFPDEMKNY